LTDRSRLCSVENQRIVRKAALSPFLFSRTRYRRFLQRRSRFPCNPRAFNDVFTDISPLFVINNESGWYEGWMIHDITVPSVAPPRPDGHAQFGAITERDAALLKRMGTGNNVPGNIFTVDGRDPHFLSPQQSFFYII